MAIYIRVFQDGYYNRAAANSASKTKPAKQNNVSLFQLRVFEEIESNPLPYEFFSSYIRYRNLQRCIAREIFKYYTAIGFAIVIVNILN